MLKPAVGYLFIVEENQRGPSRLACIVSGAGPQSQQPVVSPRIRRRAAKLDSRESSPQEEHQTRNAAPPLV